jgi:type IV pilus assembly protein PilY1
MSTRLAATTAAAVLATVLFSGASNVQQTPCAKAAPQATSQSSGGLTVFQSPTPKTGAQVYLAYYFPSDSTGQLMADAIGYDPTVNRIVLASKPTWDARCVLSGATSARPCSTGSTNMAAEDPTNARVMLTWNGSRGIPFTWAALTGNEQSTLDAGDWQQTSNRLDYLRGITTNEISSTGTCPQLTRPGLPCFRRRSAILGDIVDSSPTWVGPAQTYDLGTTFRDQLQPTDTAQEVSYDAFRTAQQGRLNVVYVGANDGFVHGFRSGSMDAEGNLVSELGKPNDGYEVLAYMPGAILQAIHAPKKTELDYSSAQYAHNWYVDATPASGDLFYGNAWHTWLVGGLGPGGSALYALDITDPSTFSQQGGAPANTVVGEWTPANLRCSYPNGNNCQDNLGNTYGTPLIRRFHDGSWGVIFGNGYDAKNTNAAGIFIMLINPQNGTQTFYYLGAPPTNSNPNGIAYPASADLDLDHVVDYIYAGDLQGNVWRFDVTSTDPTQWSVTNNLPLFTTPARAPITSGMTVSVLRQFVMTNVRDQVVDSARPARVIINFGTGRQIHGSLTSPAQYATAPQYLFGIWDWNFNYDPVKGWNAISSTRAVALDPGKGAWPIQLSTLQAHTITTVPQSPPALSYRTVSQEPICWVAYEALDASSACKPGVAGTQYGWYIQLPAQQEQIIFNPVLSPDGELVVNTFIPPQDSPPSCHRQDTSTGFSMAVQPGTGSADPGGAGAAVQSYFTVGTNTGTAWADGVQLNGTGIPSFLSSGRRGDHNAQYLLTQTPQGPAPPTPTNRHVVVSGKRLNWIQRR